jgi:hypothetical protein
MLKSFAQRKLAKKASPMSSNNYVIGRTFQKVGTIK